ncbi:unnamed protein product [Penicillium salamii]|nr:unnamed protein product [Penicillium salamii]CAG8384684.1 unnamed protein product [Penicillium salamii]
MKPHASSQRFPAVHWIWKGAISFAYEVHPRIVVKVPQPGQENRERFNQELAIYRTFSQNGPCPYIIQYYYLSDDGIFLEYMRDVSLFSRIHQNQIRDEKTKLAAKVEKLEPLHLRLQWMNHLTQAVAYLESLNLAHGDLRPENILLDRNPTEVI